MRHATIHWTAGPKQSTERVTYGRASDMPDDYGPWAGACGFSFAGFAPCLRRSGHADAWHYEANGYAFRMHDDDRPSDAPTIARVTTDALQVGDWLADIGATVLRVDWPLTTTRRFDFTAPDYGQDANPNGRGDVTAPRGMLWTIHRPATGTDTTREA